MKSINYLTKALLDSFTASFNFALLYLSLHLFLHLFTFNNFNASAALLPVDFLINKSVQTTGRKIISIEQEVIFEAENQKVSVLENWSIEGNKNLKLNAVGQGAIKNNLRYNALYNSKTKNLVIGKNKHQTQLSTDFFERYFFIRSEVAFAELLKDLKISSQARLSRADGVVAYAIGEPSSVKLNPQIWIDQDLFLMRKIRLPSEAEVTLSDFYKVDQNFFIAKKQVIDFAGYRVTVLVKNINTRPNLNLTDFYPQNFDLPTDISFNEKTPLNELIESFYSRFR